VSHFIKGQQDRLKPRALLAERFSLFLVGPNIGVFKLLTDLVQTVELIIEVKDTSSAPQSAREGLGSHQVSGSIPWRA